MTPLWAVGLMTGTAVDGMIDLALLRSDGEEIAEFGPHALLPYPPGLPELLREALAAAQAWNFTGPEPPIFARAEDALTRAQAAAVQTFLTAQGMAPAQLGVVGFHGQTVLHRPAAAARLGATRQLGDGALMARLLGCKVAWDFRSADVAAGGQGAPLAPVYHRALLRRAGTALGPPAELAVLNLGGVGNLTWWSGPAETTAAAAPLSGQPPTARPLADSPTTAETLIAFDTGPANAPLNDWIAARGAGAMDRDGALARAGRVDEALLARLLADPWLALPPPKSLDRNAFTSAMAHGLTLADGAATLTAFAAAAVGRALELLPRRPRRLLVCGGGRHNPALMAELARRANVEALPCEAAGWSGDAIEAQCFAYLALRCLRGLPLSYPGTTGAPRPLPGGRIAG